MELRSHHHNWPWSCTWWLGICLVPFISGPFTMLSRPWTLRGILNPKRSCNIARYVRNISHHALTIARLAIGEFIRCYVVDVTHFLRCVLRMGEAVVSFPWIPIHICKIIIACGWTAALDTLTTAITRGSSYMQILLVYTTLQWSPNACKITANYSIG